MYDPREGEGETTDTNNHAQEGSDSVFYNLILEEAYDHFCHTYQPWYNVGGVYIRV